MRKFCWLAALFFLLFLLLLPSAGAEEAVFCQPGEEVTVTLSVTENPSQAVAATLFLQYDHAALALIPSNTVQNDSTFLLDLNGIAVGTPIAVSFRALTGAAAGDYAVTLELKEAGTIDEEFVDDLGFSTVVITIEGSGDFTFEEVNGGLRVTGYQGADARVNVPAEWNGLPVTAIGKQAFRNCGWVEKVSLPSSVREIGNNAFQGCRALVGISMSHVTAIGNYAFYGCSALQGVYLPNTLSSLGEYAFASCQSLASVDLPGSVGTVPKSAFMGCAGLYSVTIGEGVTEIQAQAFYSCENLTELSLPEGLLSIRDDAFSKCVRLSSVSLPQSLEILYSKVFNDCAGLTSVTVPGNTDVEAGYVFQNCSADLVVAVVEGSPMHHYCVRNKIPFTFIQH